MNKKFIVFAIGILLQIVSLILLVPAAISLFEIEDKAFPGLVFDPRLLGFIIAVIVSFVSGTILRAKGTREIAGTGIKEGFAIVTFSWVFLSLVGAIPLFVYLLHQTGSLRVDLLFTNAYFETMSGFTTTGATILNNIETMPKGILFWRSLTHWLGGMGIITLALAILPAFGIASYQMFRGEIPGPTTERLKPRLNQTAKILWGAYALLTLAETILLTLGGMPLFDSICHAFGTMATGGFSTKNDSFAAYTSPYIHWVVTVFMFFAGINFLIHYRIIFTRDFTLLKRNHELHFYVAVLLIAILTTVLTLQVQGTASKEEIKRSFRHRPLSEAQLAEKISTEKANIETFGATLRRAAFQVTSINTTTGYCIADFDVWPNLIRYLLVMLMLFGGCAGSTAGGIKTIRIMVLIKTALREVKTIVQPKRIAPLKIGNNTIEEKQVSNIIGFVVLYLTFFGLASLIMSFFIPDFTTAILSVTATISNIGPGLSGVGAMENYAWLPLPAKWILCLCMLLGRLEIYTVFIALAPGLWKK